MRCVLTVFSSTSRRVEKFISQREKRKFSRLFGLGKCKFVVINYSIFDGITRRILVQFIRTLEEFLINLLLKVEKKSYKRDIRKIFLRKSNERSLTRNTFRSLYKHNYSRLIFLPLDTWNGVGCANRRHTHISPPRYERRNFRPLSARIFQ